MNKKIIIGTRGSKLAIKYAEFAIKEIKKFYNGKIELKKIVTKGDKIIAELQILVAKESLLKILKKN